MRFTAFNREALWIPQPGVYKLQLTVDICRNVPDVVLQTAGAGGKLLLDLFERMDNGRVVAAKFLADIGQG